MLLIFQKVLQLQIYDLQDCLIVLPWECILLNNIEYPLFLFHLSLIFLFFVPVFLLLLERMIVSSKFLSPLPALGWKYVVNQSLHVCGGVFVQHVWSESEDCLPFLQLAQDYISSCGKKTLLEVLEKVFTSFRPVRKLKACNSLCQFAS